MTFRIRTVDELRAGLRRARWRFSVREIGRATGVGRTTINLLISDGEVPQPTTATIRKLSAWLDAVDAADAGGEGDTPGAASSAASLAAAPPAADQHPAGYWQGVAEATVRMLAVAGDELQSLIESGVFEQFDARSAAEGPPARGPVAAPEPREVGPHGTG